MRRADGLTRALLMSVALGLVTLVTMPAAGAISVLVEAESYDAGYNMGGATIMPIACTSASGGLAVDGLDIAGEWIEVKATVPDEACYELLVGYQAAYAETVGARVTVFDDGHTTVEADSDVELVGAGLG